MAEKDSSKERKTTDETKFDVSKIFSTPQRNRKTIIKSFNLKEENVKIRGNRTCSEYVPFEGIE